MMDEDVVDITCDDCGSVLFAADGETHRFFTVVERTAGEPVDDVTTRKLCAGCVFELIGDMPIFDLREERNATRSPDSLHREAMDWAERAVVAKHDGDTALALVCNKRAFVLEYRAARRMRLRLDDEPSRSVLYRSAACLAFDIGEFYEVTLLVAEGLAGSPTADIRRELEEVGGKAAKEKAKAVVARQDLDVLAAEQGVVPLGDASELAGSWPGERDDGFEDLIDEHRHGRNGHRR